MLTEATCYNGGVSEHLIMEPDSNSNLGTALIRILDQKKLSTAMSAWDFVEVVLLILLYNSVPKWVLALVALFVVPGPRFSLSVFEDDGRASIREVEFPFWHSSTVVPISNSLWQPCRRAQLKFCFPELSLPSFA